jgi:hypothetical protein
MKSTMGKSCFTRAMARALLVAVFFLPLHLDLDQPAGKMNLFPVAKAKQDHRCAHNGQSGATIASPVATGAIVLPASLFEFDCKQDLTVWPVLASGLIRSPPAV